MSITFLGVIPNVLINKMEDVAKVMITVVNKSYKNKNIQVSHYSPEISMHDRYDDIRLAEI